jgi:hypothetical protein
MVTGGGTVKEGTEGGFEMKAFEGFGRLVRAESAEWYTKVAIQ